MSALLNGLFEAELLERLPRNVLTSIESLEAGQADWNAVGSLLASTPTVGVALKGTGRWTGTLWEAVKSEFRSFLCTESDTYADLRQEWDGLKQKSSALAVASLSGLIGAKLGVASGVLAPLVIWLFVVSLRIGKEAVCTTLAVPPAGPGDPPPSA